MMLHAILPLLMRVTQMTFGSLSKFCAYMHLNLQCAQINTQHIQEVV